MRNGARRLVPGLKRSICLILRLRYYDWAAGASGRCRLLLTGAGFSVEKLKNCGKMYSVHVLSPKGKKGPPWGMRQGKHIRWLSKYCKVYYLSGRFFKLPISFV